MNIWENMAQNYDRQDRIEVANIITEEIINHLDNTRDKRLLDFGCGTGLVGLNLINYFSEVILGDTSKSMLDIVDKKIKDGNIKRAKTLFLNLDNETISNFKIDYIIVSQVLLHIPDTKEILKSLYHLLNNNGRLLIIDFDKNNNISSDKVHNGFIQENLNKLCLDIGFNKSKSSSFHEGEKLFMNTYSSMFLLIAEK